jgi:hypothetical protein
MPNPLSKLTTPWYPSTAIGLERGLASLVQVERARGNVCKLRRAASVTLDESLIRPSFDEPNLPNRAEFASVLNDLAASAGLLRQKRWSVALPETSVRTAILTLETAPGSGAESEEIVTWKLERTFGVPLDELTISKERLRPDAQRRERYLVIATRTSILEDYELVFSSLGWRAGLLLPRHVGESQWLTGNGSAGDALLLSSSRDGFTAVVFREKQPLILRNVSCEPEEREDELYRLLLFYRDRRSAASEETLSRMLVLGTGFPKSRAAEIANETLGTDLRPLEAFDLGLELPSRDIPFDSIAAPAGLATLSWQ